MVSSLFIQAKDEQSKNIAEQVAAILAQQEETKKELEEIQQKQKPLPEQV